MFVYPSRGQGSQTISSFQQGHTMPILLQFPCCTDATHAGAYDQHFLRCCDFWDDDDDDDDDDDSDDDDNKWKCLAARDDIDDAYITLSFLCSS